MHANLGVNLLVVDYRGFGDSDDGEGPCEEGFVKDALASYRWVVNRCRAPPDEVTRMSEDRIILFGQSIGGAVAIQCAARLLRERLSQGKDAIPLPAGIVLENTFTSMRDMATQVFPPLKFASLLLRWPLLLDEWKSAENLRFFCQNHKEWACCLLSGERDEIVPAEQMRQLHAVLNENRPRLVKYFKFPRGRHNDTPHEGGPDYWASFNKYLALVEVGCASELGRARTG
jgi:pimeloyl-ACP methyl ester carboxylesterase